jgi:hypothetical protein
MLRIVVVVALAASLAACTSAEEPQPRPDAGPITAVQPAPISPDSAAKPLPLTTYIATDEQRHLVAHAFLTLVNRCMVAAGFPARTTTSGKTASPPESWRYGVNDLDVAATHGYHTLPQYHHSQPDHTANEPPVTADEEHAYSGGDAGGCLGQAQRRLGGHDNVNYMDDQLAQSLNIVGFDLSHRDPRVVQVIEQWRTCMRTAGFAATDPTTPVNRADAPEPTAAEIDTAKADVLCKQHTELVAVWHGVEAGYQQALIEANAIELDKGRTSVAAAVRAASTA